MRKHALQSLAFVWLPEPAALFCCWFQDQLSTVRTAKLSDDPSSRVALSWLNCPLAFFILRAEVFAAKGVVVEGPEVARRSQSAEATGLIHSLLSLLASAKHGQFRRN